jgi:hypothetical protein
VVGEVDDRAGRTAARRARSFAGLWLSISFAYALARAAVDYLNFGRVAPLPNLLGEIAFVATGQAVVYALIARR